MSKKPQSCGMCKSCLLGYEKASGVGPYVLVDATCQYKKIKSKPVPITLEIPEWCPLN